MRQAAHFGPRSWTLRTTNQENKTRTYSIPISEELDIEVRQRVEDGGFGSLSEYVRSVIRADLERSRHGRLEKKVRGKFKDVAPELSEGPRALAKRKRM